MLHGNRHKSIGTFKESFFSILYIVMIISIVLICIILPNKIQYPNKNEYYIDNILSIPIGIAFFIGFYYIACLFKNKKKDRMLIIISCIFTLVLFLLARNYSFKTDWDAGGMLENAQLISENKYDLLENKYYSRYPNNILITKIFSIAYKIANFTKISDGYNYILLLNCFIYSWTGFLLYKITNYLLNNDNIALMAWMIYVLLIGFSPWIIIPYSDSISLGIVSLEAFLFFNVIKYKNEKRLIFIIALIFLSIFGYYIKPQNIIIVIAMSIISILEIFKKRKNYNIKIKQICFYSIPIIITTILSLFIVKYIINTSGFKINKEMKYGISHFLMMGWNEKRGGIWDEKDVVFSRSFNTCEERNKANIKVFKSRIKEMGFTGVINQMVKKTLINYNDGSFAYGREGKIFLEDYNTGNIQLRKMLTNIYKNKGRYFLLFKQIMQILWITTLFFSIFSFSKSKKIQILQLSIIGITLFELIFEARARYLFAYAPVYIIIACVGFENLILFFRKKKEILYKSRQKLIEGSNDL